MIKVLVAVAFYPDDKGNKKLYYTHVRNKYYSENGIDVTVLNFDTKYDYMIDNVKVISLESYRKSQTNFDLLICHAPNIRNHYLFLRKYMKNFKKIILFFHGHEIMHVSNYYPKPYKFKKESFFGKKLRNMYDSIKLAMWKSFFKAQINNLEFIFVSDWLKETFKKELHFNEEFITNHYHVINNSVGVLFEKNNYNKNQKKTFDFITIRNHFDVSTYCIDLVVEQAKKNPKMSFCIVGKGDYFKFNDLPQNVTLVDKELSHEGIIKYLNSSRCGLMPVKHDTQGVMSCEMATFGIPLITSDIPVCREIFRNFRNVKLVDNSHIKLQRNLNELLQNFYFSKTRDYFFENTVKKEINLIHGIIEGEKLTI